MSVLGELTAGQGRPAHGTVPHQRTPMEERMPGRSVTETPIGRGGGGSGGPPASRGDTGGWAGSGQQEAGISGARNRVTKAR